MNAKPQYYVQANFALAGWITICHIPDCDVETMTHDEILDAALATPWIKAMATNDVDYGDMLELRLIQESIIVHRTRVVKNETPTNRL